MPHILDVTLNESSRTRANVYVVCTFGCSDSDRSFVSAQRAAHVKPNHAVIAIEADRVADNTQPPSTLLQYVQKVCCNVVPLRLPISTLKVRFQPSADIAGQTTVKSSIQRGIRSAILSSWKIDVETLEEIWPKKESIVHVKWFVVSLVFHHLGLLTAGQQRSSLDLRTPRRAPLFPTF